MEPAAYDNIAETYHETLDPRGDGLRDPIFRDLIGPLDGQQVLALGCGQGRDARLLADLGGTVTGVDISTRLLDYARQLEHAAPRGIAYVEGNAHNLTGFDDASFDGVSCYLALIDMPDLDATIRSVARVLRPGGWFGFVIVHPCYPPHIAAVGGYSIEGEYLKDNRLDWLPPHAYHRKLSTYVNLLVDARLSITRTVEPRDSDERDDVPNLLYVRCQRV